MDTTLPNRKLPWAEAGALFLVLTTIVVCEGLATSDQHLWQRVVREDGIVEWATFWSFLLASGIWVAKSLRGRNTVTSSQTWATLGVALFCLLVALEEISWGQRLLGYRPSEYFLRHNEQQELNLHNLLSVQVRDLAFLGIAGGYGVLLPLFQLFRRDNWSQIGWLEPIIPPPILIPAFLLIILLFVFPRGSWSPEVVELALGEGFLFAGILSSSGDEQQKVLPFGLSRLTTVILMWTVALGLGVACTWGVERLQTDDPENIELVHTELAAIRRDFLELAKLSGGQLPESNGFDERLYVFIEKNNETRLFSGEFAKLTEGGMAPTRAKFFLDPWNSPYWIRDVYDNNDRERELSLYSFGPNRRRDSTIRGVGGDDIVTIIITTGR